MNKKLKSFTLIELLVATFIFVILITVGMASMTVMWHSKSKLSGSKAVQEAARLSMETMANAVKSSNGTGRVGARDYKQFAVVGSELTVFQGTVTKKFNVNGFALMEKVDDGVNPPTPWSRLTSSDVRVTSLEFSGQDGIQQPSPSPKIQPYVTIKMTIQTVNQTDVNKKDSGTFRTTVIPGSSYSFSQQNVLEQGLPYLFMPTTVCTDGTITLNNVNKSLTPPYDSQTLTGIPKCQGNLNIASDGKYLYLSYAQLGFTPDGASQWKYDGGTWRDQNVNFPTIPAGILFDLAADSKYLYSYSHSTEFLCRNEINNPGVQVCATNVSGLSTDTAINKAGMAATEETIGGITRHYVYLTNSNPPAGINPWIAKVDVTDNSSDNWQVINFKNTAGMPAAVGITYDKKDGKVWTVGPGGLCKWPSDLTSSAPSCVQTVGGKNITNAVDVSTDDDSVYIAGVDIGNFPSHKGVIKVLKSNLTSVANQDLNLPIQRLTSDIGWQFYYEYK